MSTAELEVPAAAVVPARVRRWRRYAEYRETGVEWLGEAPAHWRVMRLKDAARVSPRAEGLAPGAEVSWVPMEAIGERGELDPSRTRTPAEVGPGYPAFRDGDVLVAKISPCFENGKGALARGLVGGAGMGTTELHVLRARPGHDPAFLFYLSVSHPFRRLGEGAMYGAGGQKRVGAEFAEDFRTAFPPLPEQRAIAAFLDRETARLDALLERKERLAALLAEKRAALVMRAVTRGLDPRAPLRDSGAEWLGRIPAHWGVRPLKHATRFTNGAAFRPGDWGDEGVPIIRIENLNGGGGFNRTLLEAGPRHHVRPGDLLFAWSGSRGTSFGPFLWEQPGLHYLNQHIFRLDGFSCHKRWLFWTLRALTSYVETRAHGTIGMVHVTRQELGSIPVPVLPREEQRAIAAHLDERVAGIDRLIGRVHDHAGRLREYRAALVAAAVTGRIDVRGEE